MKQFGFSVLLSAAIAFSTEVEALQLLQGEIPESEGSSRVFSLSAESRENLVGGEIKLGDKQFVIRKVSAHQLIGAERMLAKSAEFAIFSSSYSEQTATGEPWVQAEIKLGCDKPYNSFLALYTVSDPMKIERNGALPFAQLVASLEHSDSSLLFCFIAKPPA